MVRVCACGDACGDACACVWCIRELIDMSEYNEYAKYDVLIGSIC